MTDRLTQIDIEIAKLLAEKAVLVGEDICLECGRPISPDETKSRGLHERCDRRQRRDIIAGFVTEDYLVKSGRRAPAQTGGRPRVKRSYDVELQDDLTDQLKSQDKKRRKK